MKDPIWGEGKWIRRLSPILTSPFVTRPNVGEQHRRLPSCQRRSFCALASQFGRGPDGIEPTASFELLRSADARRRSFSVCFPMVRLSKHSQRH